MRLPFESVNIQEADGSVEGYVVNTNEEQLENWVKRSGFLPSVTKNIQQKYKRIGILKSLRVKEDARSCGIGRSLLEHWISLATEKDAEALLLQADTGEQNEFDLIQWYESFGFQVTDDKNDFFPLMICKLT